MIGAGTARLDRIDIHLDVPRIPHEQLSDRRPDELSAAIQERIARAREIQTRRFTGTTLLTSLASVVAV